MEPSPHTHIPTVDNLWGFLAFLKPSPKGRKSTIYRVPSGHQSFHGLCLTESFQPHVKQTFHCLLLAGRGCGRHWYQASGVNKSLLALALASKAGKLYALALQMREWLRQDRGDPLVIATELWEGIWGVTLVAGQDTRDPELGLDLLWSKGRASGGWAGSKPVRAKEPGCWEEADSGQNGIS